MKGVKHFRVELVGISDRLDNTHTREKDMRGYNKAQLLGNVGGDPEVRTTKNGVSVANFQIATNFVYRDRTTGEKIEHTDWHRVVAFAGLAAIVQKYVHKGSPVFLEGRMRTRKWRGQDGQDRYTTEVIASDLNLLPSGNGNGAGKAAAAVAAAEATAPVEDFDDDIPF